MQPLLFDVAVALTASDLVGTPHEGSCENALTAVRAELWDFPGAAAVSVGMASPELDCKRLLDRLSVVGWESDAVSAHRLPLMLADAVLLALRSPMPTHLRPGHRS
jgi:hypothetical protein